MLMHYFCLLLKAPEYQQSEWSHLPGRLEGSMEPSAHFEDRSSFCTSITFCSSTGWSSRCCGGTTGLIYAVFILWFYFTPIFSCRINCTFCSLDMQYIRDDQAFIDPETCFDTTYLLIFSFLISLLLIEIITFFGDILQYLKEYQTFVGTARYWTETFAKTSSAEEKVSWTIAI